MKILFFLPFYLIITTYASTTASLLPNPTSKSKCFRGGPWNVFILNKINDSINVHIRSRDDNLGSTTLAFNAEKHLQFCMSIDLSTQFVAHFFWKSKTAVFNIFNNRIANRHCKEKRCIWIVKENGFFVTWRKDYSNPEMYQNWK